MIKKLDLDKRNSFGTVAWLENMNEPSGAKLVETKVNELIDAVNYLQNHIADTSKKVAERMIGCTTLDIPESYKADPYAEQRKWIGKLCLFSNGDGFDDVGYLTEIDPDMPEEKFRCNCLDYYKECKPVKPDDDIIYKGE